MTATAEIGRPILLLDADETVAELACRALGDPRRVRAVRRVDEALRLLSTERFGLAILDHRLEDGESWPILAAAQALSPRVPVIVVTATGDDGVATEAFHRGASAYLIKTGTYWDRLPAIVDRFARDAAVEDENAILASVVRNSADAVVSGTLSGEVKTWNAAAERMFGYARSEIVGRTAAVLFPPDRLDELAQTLKLLAAGSRSRRRSPRSATRRAR